MAFARPSPFVLQTALVLGLTLALTPLAPALVISEIMYHPEEPDDGPTEYIELYNETADPLDLSGYSICNGVFFEFPEGTWLNGKSFLVVCADVGAVRGKHGITNTVGSWYLGPDASLSLSNGGERIEVCNPGGKTVVEVRYNDRGKWPVGADGTGHSLEIVSPFVEVDDPDSWVLSRDRGGSPGRRNPAWDLPPTPPGQSAGPILRINEAYLFVPSGGERWVEIYNRSDASVALDGYHFTDDPSVLDKHTLPAGASIGGRGFLVLTEAEVGFSLAPAPAGEKKFIALVDPSLRVVDAYNFAPQYQGYSEAKVAGDDLAYSPAADPTRGAPNAVSVTTDIVINELMYHPIDGDRRKEYVELYNRGTEPVDLTGYALSDGIQFTFAPGTVVPAGGYLVVARDPALIRSIYGLDASRCVGPQTPEALADFGFLRDRGERVTLSDPQGRTVDTVRYHDGGQWPLWADGNGSSLELIDPRQDNRVAQAWDSSDDSEKAETAEFSYVGRHVGGESELAVLLLDRGITVVDDISVLVGGVTITDTPLVEVGETWRYLKGTAEPPASWKDPGFDDAAWASGPTGIGYGDGDDATVLSDMQNNYMTIFCRKVFDVANPTAVDGLVLSVVVDDGFYAYLNGTLVASDNVAGPGFDVAAPNAGEPHEVTVDLTTRKGLLTSGSNVLAVQVHNAGLGSSDLSFIPRLVDRTTTPGGGTEYLPNGHFDTNATGWMIEGNHIRSGRTTQRPIRGAGSLKLLATGRGDNKVNRLETPTATGVGLANLPTNQDLLISFKARWAVGSQSILTHGYEHEMARSHALVVPSNLGTPGAANSVTLRQIAKTGGNLGPLITDVWQDPAVPGAGAAVTVSAKVVDPDGVSQVTLRYSLSNPTASPTSIGMTPVGDDRYAATIPGQTLATRVVFFIAATDGAGDAERYPVDIRERSHPLLLDPPAASLNDQRYCIYRHDVKNPSTPYESYRFYMTAANESELSSRKRLSNDPVDGSFLYGGTDIYYEAKTRFSGSPWARGGWGGSFRIYMPKDRPLHGRYRSFNVEDNQGNALDARTRITHYIASKAQGSVSLPYTEEFTMVRWQVNDRTTVVRERNWVPDGDFLSRWFPGDDEGDFLEMDDRFVIDDAGNRTNSTDGRVLYPPPSSRSDGNGENKENYRWFFGLRAKRGADDFRNFIAFAKVMDPGRTSHAQFDEEIWDHANVEEMLRIFAIEMNIDDWDTWGCNRGKNCYFYRPEEDGRFHLIMWDVELTYGNTGSFNIPTSPTATFNPGGFSEVNRMMNRPAVRRMYYAILKEAVIGPDRWFHSDRLKAFATRLASFGMQNTGIAQPGGYIDQRAANVASRLSAAVYPQVRLRITTNGGNDFSTPIPVVDMAGSAPADASFLFVAGEYYEASFGTMTTWAISGIPLIPGANVLAVEGYDFQGNFVDAATITVTFTGNWAAPRIVGIDPEEALPGATIRVEGSDFHNGLKVFFGTTQSAQVTYDENGPTPSAATALVPSGAGLVNVTVRNLDGQTSNAVPFTFLKPPPAFVRGDANGSGVVDISDALKILLHLFAGSAIDCADALDVDDDEAVNVTDAVALLEFLFRGGPAPRAPFPTPGPDPSGTTLGCDR